MPAVQGFVTSWKQVTTATLPVPAVRMSVTSARTKRETFVDVVARGGAEWIRVYPKKPSQLLNEFREQDSYLTSDDESDDEDPRARRDRVPLRNTLTRLVDDLLEIAEGAERIPGAAAPTLTLRLTRLEEFPPNGHPDPRIPATFDYIRKRGVKLLFGDLSDIPLSSIPTSVDAEPQFRPTRKINLDPTALMGLCSDLLHYPLPSDAAGARERYYRPPDVLAEADHQGGGRGNWEEADEQDAAQSQNSRELVRSLLEEMESPLVEVIRDMLTPVVEDEGPLELWATRDAVTYLRETISSEEVVGEGLEQRRMRRMLDLEEGDFWEGSRYEGKAGVLSNPKIHIFDEEPMSDELTSAVAKLTINGKSNDHNKAPACPTGITSFHYSTAAITNTLVKEYYACVAGESVPHLPPFLNPRRLPSPRVARISTPFAVVSLDSLARGSREGMTTLSMGHVIFRELYKQPRWRPRGWTQSNYEVDGEKRNAVAWILPYRSLGEGKRVKFAAGDYSFPRFVQRIPGGE